MAFLVIKFLAHLKERDRLLHTMGENCHEFQRENIKAVADIVEKNEVVMRDVISTLGEVRGALPKRR